LERPRRKGKKEELNCLSRFLHLPYYVVRLGTSGEGRDEDPLGDARSERRSLESSLRDERDRHNDDFKAAFVSLKGLFWTVVNRRKRVFLLFFFLVLAVMRTAGDKWQSLFSCSAYKGHSLKRTERGHEKRRNGLINQIR
jgi:hypothetical protein